MPPKRSASVRRRPWGRAGGPQRASHGHGWRGSPHLRPSSSLRGHCCRALAPQTSLVPGHPILRPDATLLVAGACPALPPVDEICRLTKAHQTSTRISCKIA